MRFVVLFGMIVVLGGGCVVAQPVESPEISPVGEIGDVLMDEATCTSSGGAWEACGSACRGQETDVCVTICVQQCLCLTDDQCPDGYTCGEFIDDEGVCLQNG